MKPETLQLLKDSGLVAAVGLYLFKSIWGWIIGSAKMRLKTLSDNTAAIAKLTVQVANLEETISRVPRLEKDIYYAHEKIRSMVSDKVSESKPTDKPN